MNWVWVCARPCMISGYNSTNAWDSGVNQLSKKGNEWWYNLGCGLILYGGIIGV